MIDRGKVGVLGVEVDAVDYEAAVERVIAAAQEGRAAAVSALAVHGVMTGVDDPEQLTRLNRFDMVTPDVQLLIGNIDSRVLPFNGTINWIEIEAV